MKRISTIVFCMAPVGIVLLSIWWEAFTGKHPNAIDPILGAMWFIAFFAQNLLTGVCLFLACYSGFKMERKPRCILSGLISALLLVVVMMSPYTAVLLRDVFKMPVVVLWSDARVVTAWGVYLSIFIVSLVKKKKRS